MIGINGCLNEILQDFRQYAESGNRLCKLKDVHFDGGRIPKYADVNVQQLYLLRYAYAYAFEYKRMYQKLLEMIGDEVPCSVTSVGCGSMIDYWSLKHVFPAWCEIDYIGVDKINWSYRDIFCNYTDGEFWEGDFVDFIKNNAIIATDIYMFPKSISEFSCKDIDCICGELSRLIPRGKSVYFLFSLRSSPMSLEIDQQKTGRLCQSMLDLGFSLTQCADSSDDPLSESPDLKINKADRDFYHPAEVVNYLSTELPTLCNEVDRCINGADCVERLGRWPILNCGQMRWQIFQFTKEA